MKSTGKYPLVSIFITNWNGEEVISDCIKSLKTQSYKNIEIIVIDNNSKDESVNLLKKAFPSVRIIQNKQNTGFAKGNNLGLKIAKGEFILIFNNDARASSNVVSILVRKLTDNSEVGIVQAKLLYEGNDSYTNGVINSVGSYFTWTGFLYYLGYGKKPTKKIYNQERYIFSAYGACMLMKRSLIESIGLFDNDYFAYFEETDLCLRALLSGRKILYTPDAIVNHSGGFSARKFGNTILYHSFKNRLCTYIKNFQLQTLLFLLPLHVVICQIAAFAYLFTGRIGAFIAVQQAFLWNINNLGSTFKKRKRIQKIRIISDSEFLPTVTKYPRFTYYLYLFFGLQYYKD